MSPEAPKLKRFYDKVSVCADGERFAVALDGRIAKTASLNPLTASKEALAEKMAREWGAQGEFIDRETMPITSLLSVAIDGGDRATMEWTDDIIAYLNSDLLCYRAETPELLISRQQQEWDPFLDWLRQEFDIRLSVTSGIVSITQPEDAAEKIASRLCGQQPETIFALKRTTALTGSAVLALALWKKAFSPTTIFEASRLDERFQEERWGVDHEAKAREEHLRLEFQALATILSEQ